MNALIVTQPRFVMAGAIHMFERKKQLAENKFTCAPYTNSIPSQIFGNGKWYR